MYKLKHNDTELEFPDLASALKHAQTLDAFVSITGIDAEIVGKFGVDAVEDATLPDGSVYSWTMRRDETHRSWKKKST